MALPVGSSHVFKITKALTHVDFPGVAEHPRGIRVFHPPRKKPENSGSGNSVTWLSTKRVTMSNKQGLGAAGSEKNSSANAKWDVP